MQEKMLWLQSHQPRASFFPYELSFSTKRFSFGAFVEDILAVGGFLADIGFGSYIEGTEGNLTCGEIQLTDAIAKLLEHKQVLAYEFEGTRYDCGTKLGYLQANVEYGLKHPELKYDFTKYIESI